MVVRPVTESVPGVEMLPAALIVVVAVPPKYAVSCTERRVEEACIIEVRPVSVVAPVTESVPPAVTFPVRVEVWVTERVPPVEMLVLIVVAPKTEAPVKSTVKTAVANAV